MITCAETPATPSVPLLQRLFVTLFGSFLGLALLKFGNPPIMEKFVTPPANGWEFVLNSPWPISWAYVLLAGVTVLGVFVAKWQTPAPRWLVALPLLWAIWQILASAHTVSAPLSRLTVEHFIAC